jgi:hypothetical protein
MKILLLATVLFGIGIAAAEEQYNQQINQSGTNIYDLYKQSADIYNVHKQHRETDNQQQNVKVEVKVEK